MKVLHLPSSVGQNAWHLAQAEKALGVHSEVLVNDASYLKYPADIHVDLSGLRNPVARAARLGKHFLSVRGRYDVFHFNWGTSLLTSRSANLNHLDLPLYPQEARLFVTYNGCDARQRGETLRRGNISACQECTIAACTERLDRSRVDGIEKMAKYVEHMWAVNPDLLHFLPKHKSSFLPYAVAGTGDPPAWPRDNGALRVVHAPTNRDIKGTRHLLAAVDRINQRQPGSIELVLVEGRSHEDALEVYRTADLVVDQLLVGWYGAFAVECMLMGKPVLVRIERSDLHFLPAPMAEQLASAVIDTAPAEVEGRLEACLADRTSLAGVARAGHAYARHWHDPAQVAATTVARYRAALG